MILSILPAYSMFVFFDTLILGEKRRICRRFWYSLMIMSYNAKDECEGTHLRLYKPGTQQQYAELHIPRVTHHCVHGRALRSPPHLPKYPAVWKTRPDSHGLLFETPCIVYFLSLESMDVILSGVLLLLSLSSFCDILAFVRRL